MGEVASSRLVPLQIPRFVGGGLRPMEWFFACGGGSSPLTRRLSLVLFLGSYGWSPCCFPCCAGLSGDWFGRSVLFCLPLKLLASHGWVPCLSVFVRPFFFGWFLGQRLRQRGLHDKVGRFRILLRDGLQSV